MYNISISYQGGAHVSREKILQLASRPEALEKTTDYLTQKMRAFLKKGERVLICFDDERASLGSLFKQAVCACGAQPIVWGPDYRWRTLLRQAFENKVRTVIGPPLVILGLTKLARAKGTPLYVRNVLTAGYPCLDWMIDGIINGLDCKTWGCFDWRSSCVVAGFSCGRGRGVHLRDDEYGVKVVDEHGNDLPPDSVGEVLLYHKSAPADCYPTMDKGRVDRSPCACGSGTPRLLDIFPGARIDERLINSAQEIMRWTSVLDCRIAKTEGGLEIEIVVFPGEQLPKLPSCAKLVVRPWNPETDVPFYLSADLKNPAFNGESH